MSSAPPHDLAVERVVIGSMMLSPDVIDDVRRIVQAAAFYSNAHATLFQAICQAHEAGDPVDPAAITTRLTVSGDITRVGGVGYLLELVQSVPVAAQATWYAERVRTLAVARGIEAAAIKARELAHGLALEDPGGALERVRADLDQLDANTRTDDDMAHWSQVASDGLLGLEAAENAEGEMAPISTGLLDLDAELAGGFRPGQLIVVAGRTSMGKSVLGRNFVRAAAFDQKLPTALFSLEMTCQEIFNAIVAAELGINLTSLNEGSLTDNEWARLARWVGETETAQLWISDSGGTSLADIRAACRRLKRRHGLGLVVVDYLQLMSSQRQTENRQQEVANLSRGLKQLAKELMVPVVALSQLNRGPEHRVDKRPNMADLRESGAIENDANVIILIHREDYYDKESPRRGEADLIIAKNRAGEQTTVVTAAQLHLSRFTSMAVA